MYHLNSGRRIFLNFYGRWGGGKPQIKYKVLQDGKERGRLGLPDLKFYFATYCPAWVKEWMLLRNRRLLEFEAHDLRFGWHGYLWYDKLKVT